MSVGKSIELVQVMIAIVVMVVIAISIAVFAWHIVMPNELLWLSDQQLENVTGVVIAYAIFCTIRYMLRNPIRLGKS